jgi:hypothetical protein
MIHAPSLRSAAGQGRCGRTMPGTYSGPRWEAGAREVLVRGSDLVRCATTCSAYHSPLVSRSRVRRALVSVREWTDKFTPRQAPRVLTSISEDHATMSNTTPPPVIIPAEWLTDQRLRHIELGLLARLLATGDDRTPVARLVDESADGRDTITGAAVQLERLGYAARAEPREGKKRGRGWGLSESAARQVEAARQGQVPA